MAYTSKIAYDFIADFNQNDEKRKNTHTFFNKVAMQNLRLSVYRISNWRHVVEGCC